MTVIKREMQKHNELLNEKEYKQYIEKFFDMLLRFLVPELAAKKSATYTRRYGRSSAPILPAIRWNPTTGPSGPSTPSGPSVERKSKRKTRRLRK
jgi:hypothetical protein